MTNSVQTKSFKTFIVKIAAFVLIVFVLDFMIGSLLKKFYFKQQGGYDYLTTYSIDHTSQDVLIFGSSRAVNIFDPAIFTNRTGLSCFNVGRYGEPVFYHYAVLKSVLERYQPKRIILSFDAGNFSKAEESYDRISVLLPYYRDHPEMDSIISLKGRYEKLKLLSRIYPYNSLVLPIITGNTSYSKKKYPHYNGYIPISRTFSGPLQTFDYAKEKVLDTNKINIYKAFIRDCIKAKIPLHIVCPPYMINAVGTDSSISVGKVIANEFNIPFLDHSRDTFYTTKPALFADYRHLNDKGVALFSNMIIDKIYGVGSPGER